MLVGTPINTTPYTPPQFSATPLDSLLSAAGALPVTDLQSTAFQGVLAMTQGQTYAAGRSVEVDCTVAGGITFTLADGSARTRQLFVGTSTIPYAVTSWILPGSGPATVALVLNLK